MELLLPLSIFGDDDDDDAFGAGKEEGGFELDDDSLDFASDEDSSDEDANEKNPLGIEGIGEDF
jgi:hypothetical protein